MWMCTCVCMCVQACAGVWVRVCRERGCLREISQPSCPTALAGGLITVAVFPVVDSISMFSIARTVGGISGKRMRWLSESLGKLVNSSSKPGSYK